MLLFNCQIILIIKKKISKWIACAVYFSIETVPGKIFCDFDLSHELIFDPMDAS